MNQLDDIELLQQFAEQNSEEAFATLVRRYIDLVYSAALRHVGNPHQAEEIVQAVFIIFARKAGSLRAGTILSGWLYHTSRLTALNFLRTERRRAQREQEAQMQSLLNESPEHPDDTWRQIAPLLDDALAGLNQNDRDAIVLRYFENRSMGEVSAVMRVPEATGRKRVTRAVERLRIFFSKRGVALSTMAIAGAVSANSVHGAPAGLAAAVGTTAVQGTLTASITALVKGTMKLMTWMKLKFALGLGVVAVLTGGLVTVAVSQAGSSDDNSSAQGIAKEALDTYAALTSYSSTGKVVQEGSGQTSTTTFSIRLQRPNLYRIDWSQAMGVISSKGIVWSAGDGDYLLLSTGDQTPAPEKMRDMQMALASATGVSSMAAATIPGTFFGENWGDVLRIPASGRSQVKKERDESVGGVDCYVVSSTIDPAKLPSQARGKAGVTTTTLWIGKQDHLIHQTRTSMEGASVATPELSDSDLKTMLERQNRPATPEAVAALRAQLATAQQHAETAMKSGKFVWIQTHENISVNQTYSSADFSN